MIALALGEGAVILNILVQRRSVAVLALFWTVQPAQGLTNVQLANPPTPTLPNPSPPSGEVAVEDDAGGDDDDEEEIIVSGARERGAVPTSVPPEVQLRSRAIRALGVTSVEEVLEELAPQARGRDDGLVPIALLNGRRISSFAAIRDLPPEAIYRVDVFPEEVALQFGYPPGQRIVNFVLRRNYKAVTLQGRVGYAPEGNRAVLRGKSSVLRLTPIGRWHVDLDYRHEGAVAARTGDALIAETISPRTDEFAANGTVNSNLGAASATLNGRFQLSRAERRLFYPFEPLQVTQRSRDEVDVHVGLTLDGPLDTWRWSLIGNVDLADRDIKDGSSPGLGSALQRASTSRSAAQASLLVSGNPLSLPAGDVAVSGEVGTLFGRVSGETTGLLISTSEERVRRTAHAQASVDVPLVGRNHAFPGELWANFNARVEHLSDMGSLTRIGSGLRWQPVEPVIVSASLSREAEAPTLVQLAGALVVTPALRAYDYRLGETVPLIRLDGGNPALRPERRRLLNVRAQVRPPAIPNLSISADYTRTRGRGAIIASLGPTPQVEAAFPERFVRNGGGRLTRFDERAANFAGADRQRIRWGVNFAQRFGPLSRKQRIQSISGEEGAAAEPTEEAAVQPGRRPQPGLLSFALYHTFHLQHLVTIRNGDPELDLLDGAAVGRGGGQPRHELELQGGFARGGLGARVSVDWQSSTAVRTLSGAEGEGHRSELIFSKAPEVNLRLFIDLGSQRWLAGVPWLRGRLNLAVDNLFNSRTRVRDASGATPDAFERGYTEPLGRSFRITLRKNFRSR